MQSSANPRWQQKQTLDNSSWMLNSSPNEAYTNIKRKGKGGQEEVGVKQASGGKGGKGEKDPAVQVLELAKGEVVINVGDFQWRTVVIGGAPALVALREVETPAGLLTQGFQVALSELARTPSSSDLSMQVLPGAPANAQEAALVLPGASFHVAINNAPSLTEAQARGREIRNHFLWTFFMGVAIAVLAGLCVVGLVRQSERLARQRSQFAAAAAHELRTPLAGLRMYGEMLADGLGDPAKSKDYARRVADEAERLGRVVGNVLNFTRLERGTLALKPEPGDLGALVRDCLVRQRPALEATGARVELDLPEPLPQARFDRDAVCHILQNLLDNAEKYSRAAADRTIRVALAPVPGAPGLVLSVADRGPGIPADLRQRLFRPFERGADPDAPPGLGLGLALSRSLARAQGGELAWSAAEQGGAIFSVRFPA